MVARNVRNVLKSIKRILLKSWFKVLAWSLGFKYIKPAPEDIVKLVNKVASEMNVKVKSVYICAKKNHEANAMVFFSRVFIYHDSLNVLNLNELEALIAHELSHLSLHHIRRHTTEMNKTFLRIALCYAFMVLMIIVGWIKFFYIMPEIAMLGARLSAITLLSTLMVLWIRHANAFGCQLELEADLHATSAIKDALLYAITLIKLHVYSKQFSEYGKPFPLRKVIKRLKDIKRKILGDTHPNLKTRIMYLEIDEECYEDLQSVVNMVKRRFKFGMPIC
ncbi:MAG: hypothetical protein DRJ31_05450 [Candidatus Methanomethylicota archaeon]|mgnify:CR=1 FL=1|uniref:Peptidase M48 domain-containing protein n=1 Tax=Thermoproteota archaeon TaxID=2056631 RepID=A0A497EQE7_9CREN|nr:MAG: hypothetical protein DRJ31_05450 [Candidatus Verstraetearchaeota archaeon]